LGHWLRLASGPRGGGLLIGRWRDLRRLLRKGGQGREQNKTDEQIAHDYPRNSGPEILAPDFGEA
jgi:hypothetical protein